MSIAEKMSEIAENVPLVYRAGQEQEWSDFWDGFQQDNDGILGNRSNYNYAFRTRGWNQVNFKPKYDITPANSTYMFELFNQWGTMFDFAQHLENLGIILDVGNCTNLTSAFYQMFVTRLPEIDASNATVLNYMLQYNRADTVDKVILKADGSQTFYNTFSNMINLKNIVIEGVIGQDGVI